MVVGCLRVCRSIQLQNSPCCKMQGMALMWQLAVLAQVVFDRRQRKREGGKEKNGNIKVNFWNFSSEMNCLCRDQFFLSFLKFLGKKKNLCFPLYLCFVTTVKNSLFDSICPWRHSVILMDSLDAGPRLAGSIFFRCFFPLWHYGNRATLYSRLNGEWYY